MVMLKGLTNSILRGAAEPTLRSGAQKVGCAPARHFRQALIVKSVDEVSLPFRLRGAANLAGFVGATSSLLGDRTLSALGAR
jgi:hypothetical protein